jgi:RimJ/RimL family protein N-acetyltransferase
MQRPPSRRKPRMSADISIRRAVPSDVAFIMATERLDGYDALVGRWSEEQHCAALDDPRSAVFIALRGTEPVGFGLIAGWDSPDRRTLIRRVAITRPGEGIGTQFVRLLIATVFEQTDTHRLTIGCFPENLRARRCYERAGFTAEGVARDSVFFGGRFRDELVLSILRPEWKAHDRRP